MIIDSKSQLVPEYFKNIPEVFIQIDKAYREMVAKALYRPAAPDDGFGNLLIDGNTPISQKEVEKYTRRWWKQEDDCTFWVGCCDMQTRAATIFAIEAAHNMCSGRFGDKTALRLLKMAVKELERTMKETKVERQMLEKVMGAS